MDFLSLVLILGGLFLLYKYIFGKSKHPYKTIPELKAYLVIGALFELNPANTHEQFSELAKKHGDIFQFRLFGGTNVVLNSVEMVNKAFSQEQYKDVFNDRPGPFDGNNLNGRSSMTHCDRNKMHSDLRKCFTRSMHIYGDGIAAFENIMRNEIHRVMEYFEKCERGQFEVIAFAERSLSNVMCILLIGEPATDEDVSTFFDYTHADDFFLNPLYSLILTKMPFARFLPPFKSQYDKMANSHKKIMDRMFHRMKETHVLGQYRGVVDWYFEEQEKEKQNGGVQFLTDEVIKATIIDILIAGLITTSAALPSVLLCLINHPGYQQKIQAEIDSVVGPEREPAVSDRGECHFLQAFVMETFRLLPPAPIFLPHVCSKDTVFEGYLIEKNTQILTNLWHMHHDENIWEEPWEFRPERFLDEEGKLLNPTHRNMKNWLAFGTGPRKCPGMALATTRIFLYVSFLLQKYRFLPCPGKCVSHDPRNGDFVYKLLLRPKPFYCVAERRI